MSPLDLLRDAVARTGAVTLDRPATGLGHDDADDVAGTIATDSAVGFDPFPLLRAVHAAGARVVVIGQVAGILHGSVELTGDLDLLWDGSPAQAPALVAAFSSVGASVVDDDLRPVALAPAAFALPKVQFSSVSASGDLCTPALPWGSLDVGSFLERALSVSDVDGLVVHYLRRDDLVLMRRAVGRPKDIRRAEELERR
ncbi:hypothetical protein [Kutzneria chonburiensis]|uniref:Uncharacterized protein n=1 Tax=Kutzneria chonburiensis TaxID=1483604 RepID=A0ABV6MS98_9PSEU|nr:hypothetical protein [Kutzneria chonburiensis]